MLYNEIECCRKLLKDPKTALKYHSYAIKPDLDFPYLNFLVTVDKKFHFTYQGLCKDANVLDKAYALQYKSCPSDTSKNPNFFFGDIYLSIKDIKKEKNKEKKKRIEFKWSYKDFFGMLQESVNQIHELPEDIKIPSYVKSFLYNLKNQSQEIWDNIQTEIGSIDSSIIDLKKAKKAFIHFDLKRPLNITHWFETGLLKDMDHWNILLREDKPKKGKYSPKAASGKTWRKKDGRYVLCKQILNTLCSGDESSDNQFINFDLNNRHKSLSVTEEDIPLLMYYHQKIFSDPNCLCKINIPHGWPYYWVLVPSGPFNTDELIEFIAILQTLRDEKNESSKMDTLADAENAVKEMALSFEDLLNSTLSRVSTRIVSFDLILKKKEGQTVLSITEINSLNRSALLKNLSDIAQKATAIQEKYKLHFKPGLSRTFSILFQNNSREKNKEKFQSQLTHFLLSLYKSGEFYYKGLDNLFIERCLYEIRDHGFDFIKNKISFFELSFSFEFLNSLRKRSNPMLSESQKMSEDLGKACARVAVPLGLCINPFEKTFIGFLKNKSSSLSRVEINLNDNYTRSVLHNGDKINDTNIKLKADGTSFNSASFLIHKFKEEEIAFSSEDFIRSFLSEYNFRKSQYTKNLSKEEVL